MNSLQNFDQTHLWHPYDSAIRSSPLPLVTGAHGVYLELADGNRVIDGMSSWWSAIHGYNHSVLNQAVQQQIADFSHVMFGGLTHQPAIDLGALLVKITPPRVEHVFFSDSGSVSVEVAMKIALQYWQARNKPHKHRFLTLRGGYHGDTFGAMSVCDPDTGMHHLFAQFLPQQQFVDRPACRFDTEYTTASSSQLHTTLQNHHHNLAAVIVEPIVQGAGGMWFYHPHYLQEIRQLCDRYQLLLICDEIATGFGRTGKLFACEWADISPDILCLGKALSGGYMSLAATMTSREIATRLSEPYSILMHGPTFMANPLACSVALHSTRLLVNNDWQQTVKAIESILHRELKIAREFRNVADVRVLGAIGVIEMKHPLNNLHATEFFIQRGVWIRPFGKLLYIMPPYIIAEQELLCLTQAMLQAAEQL